MYVTVNELFRKLETLLFDTNVPAITWRKFCRACLRQTIPGSVLLGFTRTHGYEYWSLRTDWTVYLTFGLNQWYPIFTTIIFITQKILVGPGWLPFNSTYIYIYMYISWGRSSHPPFGANNCGSAWLHVSASGSRLLPMENPIYVENVMMYTYNDICVYIYIYLHT